MAYILSWRDTLFDLFVIYHFQLSIALNAYYSPPPSTPVLPALSLQAVSQLNNKIVYTILTGLNSKYSSVIGKTEQFFIQSCRQY